MQKVNILCTGNHHLHIFSTSTINRANWMRASRWCLCLRTLFCRCIKRISSKKPQNSLKASTNYCNFTDDISVAISWNIADVFLPKCAIDDNWLIAINSSNGVTPIRRQAITWTNFDSDLLRLINHNYTRPSYLYNGNTHTQKDRLSIERGPRLLQCHYGNDPVALVSVKQPWPHTSHENG